MVEGNGTTNNSDNKTKSFRFPTKPSAPIKKFYQKEANETFKEQEDVPSIPPRPLAAPKLPMRPTTSSRPVGLKDRIAYPLEDNIYTGLNPVALLTKFYSNSTEMQMPPDFIPKIFFACTLFGLQHGKIVALTTSITANQSDNYNNRQFYDLILLNLESKSFLAFQDTGTIYKVQLVDESNSLQFSVLLKNSIPTGTAKIFLRPEINEIWVVGMRETAILRMNPREGDVALVKRVKPNHFPEATGLSFLGPEDLAVMQQNRSVKVFSVARHGHKPALIANLPAPIIGDLVKVFKLVNGGYGTIYSDGKMIIWEFEKDRLVEKVTVPLTLFRVQCVHVAKDLIWLGLGNGKLLIVKIGGDKQISILSEVKYHQAAITKMFEAEDGILVTIDSTGQMCTWDDNLSFYKQNQFIWEKEADYCDYERVGVRYLSWNVAAQSPSDGDGFAIERLLGIKSGESSDLIAISLQEIVDLNARNLISGSTNGNGSNQSQNALDKWIRYIQKRLPTEYELVHSSVMVGLALIVFCRDRVRRALSSVSDAAIKTGLGGLHGNKGGLVWRAFVYDCPVAFVACHLAAGQTSVSERNNDAATILRTATLADATESRKDLFAFATGNGGSRIFDHSIVLIAGDLNYRIEMDRFACLKDISEGKFEEMRQKDQLKVQMNRKELLLSYFKEKEATFAPTYKYDRGSVDRFDSSEKARIPAWCDRVLFYSKKDDLVKQMDYDSVPESTLSDHKPIYATFELKCRKINHQSRENIIKTCPQSRRKI